MDCEYLLASLGTTGAAVSIAANQVLLFEGPGSTVQVASLYAKTPMAGSASSTYGTSTVSDYLSHPGPDTAVKAVAELSGNRVFINSTWWGGDYFDDVATLMHEVIHNATGLTDPDFVRLIPNVKVFSDALKTKCF